jgi:ornithine cyclodeaminase/alanine dehydrogenase-like protein (mu-crystallin family)
MAIFLSNDDVRRLLPMDECIDVMEDLFRQESQGLVENLPRRRLRFQGGDQRGPGANFMGGVVQGSKAWAIRHTTVTTLYNTETGKLDAVLEPGTLAWIRTGAASGLATKYMARDDASTVGLIGTGRQAVTQLEAVCAVRPVKRVKAFSRREETRRQFAAEMRELLGVEVEPVETPDEAVRDAEIVITITNSREPVFDGKLLEPGTHINAAGANSWTRREVDDTTIERSELVVVDNLEQAKIECGELIWAAERGVFNWRRAVELHEVVSGRTKGRPSAESITLFESQGIGIEDVAASKYVLEKAKAQGVGQELPF